MMRTVIAIAVLAALGLAAGAGLWLYRGSVEREIADIKSRLVSDAALAQSGQAETQSAIKLAPIQCERVFDLRSNRLFVRGNRDRRALAALPAHRRYRLRPRQDRAPAPAQTIAISRTCRDSAELPPQIGRIRIPGAEGEATGELTALTSVLTRRRLLQTACAATASAALFGPRQSPVLAATPNLFKPTMTTLFWVGEPSDADNAFIANDQSYWDKDWQEHFGGLDDPNDRNGHWPADFTPKENPFYVALPYGEFATDGKLKTQAELVPWYDPGLKPLLKNRWVAIRAKGRVCYAQWEDVGPFGEEDFDFVFGAAALPLNTVNDRAGLDVSPAVWHYLGMNTNGLAAWRFVDISEVPEGPWTEIVTISANNR